MTTQETTIRIWQVLIAAAHHRHTVGEEELAELTGTPDDGLAAPLAALSLYCEERRLPSLTALVAPGAAGSSPRGEGDRERVFDYPWFSISSPGKASDDGEPQPAKRPCPHCGRLGNTAATLCGFCWARLTPEVAESASR